MFLFDARDIIDYEEFNSFNYRVKKNFETKKNEIFSRFKILRKCPWNGDIDNYQLFRKEYRKCVIEMFQNVIIFYKKWLPAEHIVLLEGSYGRDSDRIFSDIDYTLIYDVEKNEHLICIEELINLSLARICNISRDRVHSIFTYLPNKDEYQVVSENGNEFKMIFESSTISYKCRENTMADVVSNILSVRDYHSFISYLETEMQINGDTEWLYSFKVISNTSHYDFQSDLFSLEEKHNNFGFSAFSIQHKLRKDTEFSIASLKQIIKYELLNAHYLFISRARKIYQEVYKQYDFINVDKFLCDEKYMNLLGKSLYCNIKAKYVEYLFYLNRLELSLFQRGIELSSHSHVNITYNWIESICCADWGENILNHIINLKNDLFNYYNEAMITFRKNYELAIYTFPCTPRNNNTIEKCLVYLIADYMGEVVSNSNKNATFNIMGISMKNKMLLSYKEYIYDELGMSFDNEFSDFDYIDFACEKIKYLYDIGVVSLKNKNVMTCPCGIVELCVDNDENAYLNPSLFKRECINGKEVCVCKHCGCKCTYSEHEVMVISLNYELESLLKVVIYPQFSKKQFNEIASKMQGKDIMISRFRKTGLQLKLGEKMYNIDIDFIWQFLILTTECKHVCALTGYREIFYIFLSAYINNLLFEKDINYLTLPYVLEEQDFKYELPIDVQKIAYVMCTKLNKQNSIMTNGLKKYLSRKKTFTQIKKNLYKRTAYKFNNANAFTELCETIVKRQQQL